MQEIDYTTQIQTTSLLMKAVSDNCILQDRRAAVEHVVKQHSMNIGRYISIMYNKLHKKGMPRMGLKTNMQ
jgi:hypothetical protein